MITQDEKREIDEIESVEECVNKIRYWVNTPYWSRNHQDRRDRINLIAAKAKKLLSEPNPKVKAVIHMR